MIPHELLPHLQASARGSRTRHRRRRSLPDQAFERTLRRFGHDDWLRLAPEKGWAVNQPGQLAKVLETLEGIESAFNGAQPGGNGGRGALRRMGHARVGDPRLRGRLQLQT